MPTVKNVGEPCAGEPHARFDVAAGGNQASRARTAARPRRLPSTRPLPMGRPAGWMKELTGRSAMKSPGHPSHRREVELWFWREIAKGLSSEDAARGRRGLLRRLAAGGSASVAGWRRCCATRSRADICASPSARRSRCCAPRARACSAIAREIGRSPSTISRELRRNAATRGGKLEYRASVAQWKAELVAAAPRRPSSPPTSSCASTCRSAWPARSAARDGTAVAGPAVKRGRAATSRARRSPVGDGVEPGADLGQAARRLPR